MIKIEINYSLRTHVFQAEERCLLTDAFGEPISVNTVAVAEIFAAKANALMSRAAARNLLWKRRSCRQKNSLPLL